MRPVELSARMRAVAGLVTPGAVVADIGCDHGYVSIYLVERGICPRAFAMDVRKGPLECAGRNVRAHGLSDKITLRLSDGLKELSPGEAQDIVIAGMGGLLVIDILTGGFETGVLPAEGALILQPQSEIGRVREFLARSGYRIENEEMVREDGKYYPMMRAVPGRELRCAETDHLYGGILLERRHPVLLEYLQREREKLLSVREGLLAREQDHAGDIPFGETKAGRRILSIEEELRINGEALHCFE